MPLLDQKFFLENFKKNAIYLQKVGYNLIIDGKL